MRKIEQEMVNRVRCGGHWEHDNTRTVAGVMPSGLVDVHVYLHGNHIAKCRTNRHQIIDVFPNCDTFRNWPTMTTASRLRALGVNASIRNGKACIDGVPV